MPYLVYKISNTINHKLYVGSTTLSLEERWAMHCIDVKALHRPASRRPLYVAMRLHGIQNFTIELLEECPDESTMYLQEIVWTRKLKSRNKNRR